MQRNANLQAYVCHHHYVHKEETILPVILRFLLGPTSRHCTSGAMLLQSCSVKAISTREQSPQSWSPALQNANGRFIQ